MHDHISFAVKIWEWLKMMIKKDWSMFKNTKPIFLQKKNLNT